MRRKRKSTDSASIEVPIFNAEIDVFFGKREDFEDWLNSSFEIKDPKLSEEADAAEGLVFELEDYGYIGHIGMFLNDFSSKLEKEPHLALGTLSHECVHAAKSVCESRGMPFDEDNEELAAYLVGFLVQAVLDKCGKVKKKS